MYPNWRLGPQLYFLFFIFYVDGVGLFGPNNIQNGVRLGVSSRVIIEMACG